MNRVVAHQPDSSGTAEPSSANEAEKIWGRTNISFICHCLFFLALLYQLSTL